MTMPTRKTATSLIAALTIGLLASQIVGADREGDSRKGPRRNIGVVKQTPAQKINAPGATAPQPAGDTSVTIANGIQSVDSRPLSAEVGGQSQTVAAPLTGEQIGWMVFSGGGGRVTSATNSMDLTLGQTAVGAISNGSFKMNLGFWQEFGSGSCCVGTTGNVNMTGIVDLSDLSALISYVTGGGYLLPCSPEANVNNAGIVDLSDLSALISFVTGGGYILPNCP